MGVTVCATPLHQLHCRGRTRLGAAANFTQADAAPAPPDGAAPVPRARLGGHRAQPARGARRHARACWVLARSPGRWRATPTRSACARFIGTSMRFPELGGRVPRGICELGRAVQPLRCPERPSAPSSRRRSIHRRKRVRPDEAHAFFINTARGRLVDQPALVAALRRAAWAARGWTCLTKSRCPRIDPLHALHEDPAANVTSHLAHRLAGPMDLGARLAEHLAERTAPLARRAPEYRGRTERRPESCRSFWLLCAHLCLRRAAACSARPASRRWTARVALTARPAGG